MQPQNESFWRELYQQQQKNKKLSVEMLIRKSFMDALRDYGRNCSLAGVRQMCDPDIGIFKRIIWLVVFLLSLAPIVYFLLYLWSDVLMKPLIVSMESSTYPIAEIDFPAISICNVNRISKKALVKLSRELYPELAKNNESMEEVQYYVSRFGNLIDYSYNETDRNHPIFAALLEKYRLDTHRIVDIMKKLAPQCDDLLVKCEWASQVVDCKSIFITRRTAKGHCCTFNYLIKYDATGRLSRKDVPVLRQAEAGAFYGLNLIVDPMIHDYIYPLSASLGFDIMIFNPMQFADSSTGRIIHRKLQPNSAMFYEIVSTKQVATMEVRKYAASTRNCLFHDEYEDVYGDMYTYSTCLVYCRITAIESLCKCTPYYLAAHVVVRQSNRICGLDNLRCLNKYKEKVHYLYPFDAENLTGLEMEIQDSLICPKCYPDCEGTTHHTRAYGVPLGTDYSKEKDLKSTFIGPINMSDKCFLGIYHPTSDSILDRLDVVNYWFEILSNVGGFCGIILGFSLTSVAEIFYYFTIRFCHFVYTNFKETR